MFLSGTLAARVPKAAAGQGFSPGQPLSAKPIQEVRV
jgi:hypothetical protein